VRAHFFAANWLWGLVFLVLTGIVVWGWAFDFAV
jgi:hypothetical protein